MNYNKIDNQPIKPNANMTTRTHPNLEIELAAELAVELGLERVA